MFQFKTFKFKSVLTLSILCILLQKPQISEGKNILFFFGMSTYSHRITAWPLAVKLSEEGHSVTFLQGLKNRNPHPNITDMIPDTFSHPIPPNFADLRTKAGKFLVFPMIYHLPLAAFNVCESILSSQKNIDWINSQKFDLVIIDGLFNECGYGLAYKWKAKTIMFQTSHPFPWSADSFGYPDESNSITPQILSTDMPLGFFGRLSSALGYLILHYNRKFRYLHPIDTLLRDTLQIPEMPPTSELEKNTSLVLVNTHFSEDLPRSLPPYFVPIGGMHVSGNVKPLPKDIEAFLKDSPQGFIYVSFGSEADLALAPAHLTQIFFNVIAKFPVKFLWKWGGERPKEMPSNVFTSKWMPQQDILGHSKCKGFITHGGLLGIQEAVYHGVPMVSFPIFAEQDYNAERIHRTGRGIRLELSTITEFVLESALNRLLTDKTLQHQMKLASIRFKDRSEKPVDLAMWWVNYIFRHEDTTFLRPLGINQYWYERRQLDVWIFILIVIIFCLYISIKIIKLILRWCCSKTKTTPSASQTKKRK